MNAFSVFILPGGLFLATAAFGLWVSLTGRPYNGLLFNVHKLLALACVVLTLIPLVGLLKASPAHATALALLALAALCVIVLFATGAVMSIGTFARALVLLAHRIALVLLPLSLVVSVYLINRGVAV